MVLGMDQCILVAVRVVKAFRGFARKAPVAR